MRKLVAATVAVLLVFIASMSLAQPQLQQTRPNIIFIIVDDLRFECVMRKNETAFYENSGAENLNGD